MTAELYGFRLYRMLFISLLAVMACGHWAAANCPDGVSEASSSDPAQRSVRKSPATAAAWPWLAAIQVRDPEAELAVNLCAGTVIAPSWVLTAAHCVFGADHELRYPIWNPDTREHTARRGHLEVVIGVDDLRAATPQNTFRAKRVVIHEAYSGVVGGADIALIELSGIWTGAVAVLSGRSLTDPIADSLLVAGFGATAMGRDGQPIFRRYRVPGGGNLIAGCARLMQISLPQVSVNDCRRHFGDRPAAPLGREQICAGFSQRNLLVPCDGDGGGPLIALTPPPNIRPYQVGITSWGEATCGLDTSPQSSGNYTVFTRVSQFTDWIRKQTDVQTVLERPPAVRSEGPIATALADLEGELLPAKGKVSLAILEGTKFPVSEGTKLPVGAFFQLQIVSEVPGKLIVLDIDAGQRVTQLFPNHLVAKDALSVKAGVPLVLPSIEWGFPRFQASEPLGASKLLVLVAPPDFPDATVGKEVQSQKRTGLAPASNTLSYLMNLSQQVASRVATAKERGEAMEGQWAYRVVNYDVVEPRKTPRSGR
jgi:secreted trypsin-like serine protease